MTRINVIPPEELIDAHLFAEYRELPRIVNKIKQKTAKGICIGDYIIPDAYTLNKGHETFFYNKLGYLKKRYELICAECEQRGRAVNYPATMMDIKSVPPEWCLDWIPNDSDESINRLRIIKRISQKIFNEDYTS